MRILWIVNRVFPKPSKILGLREPMSGGWMYDVANRLSQIKDINLAVAAMYPNKELKTLVLDGVSYFLLPSKNIKKLKVNWRKVCEIHNPDLVHIHGTEYSHGLACMNELPHLKYVISIQGLLTASQRYYYAGISLWQIFRNITFRDIIRMDTIIQAKHRMKKNGIIEKLYLTKTKHIIGRTEWDFANTKAINKNLSYNFCNESLRNNFYSAKKWTLEKCKRHSIFLSQGDYPIKGIHQVFQSIIKLKDLYPDIRVRIGGLDITKRQTFKDKIRFSGYAKIVTSIIKKQRLQNYVLFLGPLSEMEMIDEYRNANVFICPSSIENSPNSLGEAQLIGVPTISAYVGGIPDMVVNGKTGLLYRFEETEMLSDYIQMIFEDSNLALKLSENGIEAANKRHDREFNLLQLLSIYRKVRDDD